MGRSMNTWHVVLLILLVAANSPLAVLAAPADVDAPPGLAAPWPAGVVLHAGGVGYVYGVETHQGTDAYAMDFNGNPGNENPPVETADKDLLVLAVADGCVREIKNHTGYYKDGTWQGNYGWSVVIMHEHGYQSRYAHLKATPLVPLMSYNPQACHFVAQGEPIGQIAGTGTENDASVHLHFALYHCTKPGTSCVATAVKPEPFDGVTNLPTVQGKPLRITSQNYSVGYEEIKDQALTNPAALVRHPAILDEYRRWGGQTGLFGRAAGPVKRLEGTGIYFQEFLQHPLQSIISGTIVEINSRAFLLPKPIWELYKIHHATYGSPSTGAYIFRLGGGEMGWRVDFQNASLFWNRADAEPIVWDSTNAPWKVSFCAGVDHYLCNPVRRLDPAPDFSISNSNNSGPLAQTQGFSVILEATFNENWVSKISLEYVLQGHVRFHIGNTYQSDWISSEDGEMQGITKPSWHLGKNAFIVRFWQSPDKPARLSLKIHERGLTLIPAVHAFESPGTLESSVYQPPQPEYIDYEPPPYPGEAGEESPPAEPAPTEEAPDLPSIDLPDVDVNEWLTGLEEWWQETTENIQREIEQWVQDRTEDAEKKLQEELERIVAEALESMLRQCTGGYLLAMAAVGVALQKRSRR